MKSPEDRKIEELKRENTELERENARLRKLLADNGIDATKPPFVPSANPKRFPRTYGG